MPATTVVLFGATGDLAKRKLLPGHAAPARVAAARGAAGRRDVARRAETVTSSSTSSSPPSASTRATPSPTMTCASSPSASTGCPGSAGPQGIRAAVDESEAILGRERAPAALPLACRPRRRWRSCASSPRPGWSSAAGSSWRSPSAPTSRAPRAQRRAARGLRRGADLPHRPLPRQGGGAEHPRLPLRQRPVRADLEPQPHRPRPDRRARDARPRRSGPTSTRAPAPTATWSSPTCSRCSAFMAMEPPTALEPCGHQRGEEQGLPLDVADRAARRRARAVHRLPRRSRASRTTARPRRSSRSSATIDNWRWAGVPFYLRTGKRLAEGARIISIAFKEPPRSMFPPGSGVGDNGPDHLTFDLADRSRMSLSFYGKRPGPGMKLDKLSMQFAMQRDRLGRRRARGLRAAHLRRRPRRPHALHVGRGHRAALGDVARRCSTTRPPCGPTTPARGVPTRSTSSSPLHLAAALRAPLARPEPRRSLTLGGAVRGVCRPAGVSAATPAARLQGQPLKRVPGATRRPRSPSASWS